MADGNEPLGSSPSICASDKGAVSRAVAIATAASTLAPNVIAATGTQPPAPLPAIQSATVGAKPPRAKPIWVPMAIPERRTRVGNISPYSDGQIPF
jgi:hypothetical protein